MLALIAAAGMGVFQGWMTCHHRVEFHGLWGRFLPEWDQGNGGETTATAFFLKKNKNKRIITSPVQWLCQSQIWIRRSFGESAA